MFDSTKAKLGSFLGSATIFFFIVGLLILVPQYVFLFLLILLVIGLIVGAIVYDWIENIHETESTFRITY